MAIVYFRDQDVAARGSWMPPVDVYETEAHDIVIKAELPGLSREEIEVTVENSTSLPSRPIHIALVCGLPSGLTVARTA